MTPQEDKQEQKAIDMDAATARYKAALRGGQPGPAVSGTTDAPKPPKKRRSDAGVPRKHAEPAAPATGKLSADIAGEMRTLMERVQVSALESAAAQRDHKEAVRALNAFIDSHTA